ncbi:MAG: aldo/keto reductase [Magnetococcales bacterium]|nr:aldo/keto reductase [Magnetococcales bacterium]
MERRRFGKTGLDVSVLTLGTMRLLHGWDAPHDHLPDDSLESTFAIVSTALSAGINLIETARGYGKSERLLGAVLPRIGVPRARYHIMTKAPPAPNGREMRQWIDDSLTRLGCDRIDLFALHGLNREAHFQALGAKNGVMTALRQARDEGLIGAIGFSGHATPPLLLRLIATGQFDFVNLHYYRFRRANHAAVALAQALDMGVLIISPNDKGGRLYDPPERLRLLTAPLLPAQFNERWLLAQSGVHTLSIGLSEPAHLALHLEGLRHGPAWGQTEQEIAWRLTAAESRSALLDCGQGCFACLPCPQEIEIPEILRMDHLIHCFDMTHFARYRYGMMRPGDHWVPGARVETCDRCGDCLPRCPRGLAIPELLAGARWRMDPEGGSST